MHVGDDVVVIGTADRAALHDGGQGRRSGCLIAVDASEYAGKRPDNRRSHARNDALSDRVKEQVYDILPGGPDLVIEAAGPIQAVKLMVSLRRRGTKWNVFGITTHEKFELDGGLTHFLEGRMDASFGTTPLAMQNAIRLMERGLVDPERIVSHRFKLSEIHRAVEVMGQPGRNKVMIQP